MSAIDGHLPKRAALRAFASGICLLLLGVGDISVGLASSNCSALGTSMPEVICSDQQLRSEIDHLDGAYKRLEKSTAHSVAFLANADKIAFAVSVNDCSNVAALGNPRSETRDCVAKRVEEKVARISQMLDAADIIRELQKEKFLSLALIPKYGPKFVGVVANWFGELRLEKKSGGNLVGTLSNIRPIYYFHAILEHPNTLDTAFFTEGGCQYGCSSWWNGKFIFQGKALVFEVNHPTILN